MNQGNDGSNNVPPRSSDDSPALGQRVYDTARVQRTPQIAFIRDRLDQGLSPATVAGVAAIIAQMESQVQAPMLTISITSGFPGFQRSMTYQDGVWHGHDLMISHITLRMIVQRSHTVLRMAESIRPDLYRSLLARLHLHRHLLHQHHKQ